MTAHSDSHNKVSVINITNSSSDTLHIVANWQSEANDLGQLESKANTVFEVLGGGKVYLDITSDKKPVKRRRASASFSAGSTVFIRIKGDGIDVNVNH